MPRASAAHLISQMPAVKSKIPATNCHGPTPPGLLPLPGVRITGTGTMSTKKVGVNPSTPDP